MKRFFALVALVLGLASCQTEPEGLDVQMGGAVDATITVNIPDSETRAGGSNSAGSIFDNVDLSGDATIRYILMIYDANGVASKDRQVAYSDGRTVNFDVRLVPDRHYSFVVWADYVEGEADVDYHYNTANLTNITLNDTWVAMDETRDAFTGVFNTKLDGNKTEYNGAKDINITLTRPFAKLRVVTTDIKELDDLHITPGYATVEYTTEYRPAFNALAGTAVAAGTDKKAHSTVFPIAPYTNEANDKHNRTIFTDYFFANEGDAVSFILNVYEDAAGQTLIKSNNFSTDIAVNRNYLTTISGNILTDGNKVNVTIEDAFENVDDNGNTTNPDYDYETISSVAEFYAAVNKLENGEGNEYNYIVVSDLNIDTTPIASLAATRSTTDNKKVTINLNGKTITVKNEGTEPFITLENGQTLVLAGAGNIVMTAESKASFVDNKNSNGSVIIEKATVANNSTDAKVVEGKVIVTGDANIEEDAVEEDAIVSGIAALKYILANGGEFTMTDNIEATDVLEVKSTKPVIINGCSKTFSTSANRIIRIANSKADVTINDVNFVSSAVMVYPSDVRGVSIDPDISNVQLTLNDCTIDFTDKTTNDWTYAVNVAGNGTGHKVTINGGTYEGANVVNVYGAKNTIVVKNATLNSLYPNSDMYFGACIWVLQNQESSVYAEGNTFNGDNAVAFNLGTGTTLEEKDNIDNTMYYDNGTCYVGSSEKFQKAIAEGANNIVLGKGTFDLPSSLTQNEGTLTIIGAGVEETILNGAKNSNANNPGNYANGVALEFDGLTFKTANNGYNGGFGHAVSVTFRESKIVGQFYAHSGAPHYFYDCIIDPLTGYLYTYSSNCVFERCTFSASEGKALQIYADASTGEHTVTITDCEFVAAKQAQTWDGKPVTGIDINSNGAKFEVYINNCTTTGFPTGLNSNSDLWNVKDAGKAHTNVYVDGVQVWFAGYEYLADGILSKDGEYLILNKTGLFSFANEVNANGNAFAGKTVKLTADIDLNNEAWTPVGQTGATTFNGVFDGQNYTISNLNVDSSAQTGAHYSSGLFGWVESHTAGRGHIKNVKINGATIVGHHNCGALVGYITQETALVENCHVTGAAVTCTKANDDADGDKAGALIGNATVATPIKDCTAADSTVSAGRDAGQVIGVGKEANVTGCSATNVTVSANGTSTGANVRNEVIGRLLN